MRYVETDQMGVVHHSNYFVWFEVGRTEYIRCLGMKYSDIEKAGIMMPLIECGCEFKSGARYEDELIIRTVTNTLSPVKVEFRYEVLRESDNKLLAVGFTRHAFVNSQMRPINLQKRFPEIWNVLAGSTD